MRKIYIPHFDAVKSGKTEWFIGYDNILYSVDDHHRVRSEFQLRNNRRYNYSIPVILSPDRIICLPEYDNCITDINLKTNKAESKILIDTRSRLACHSYFIDKYSLWIVAAGVNRIIEYKLHDRMIGRVYKIFEGIDGEIDVGWQVSVSNNKIYCVNRVKPQISIFDIKNKSREDIELSIEGNKGFETVSFDDNRVYLTGYRKKIYSIDLKEKEEVILPRIPEEYCIVDHNGYERGYSEDIDLLFYKTIKKEDKLLFIPWNTSSARTAEPMILLYMIKSTQWKILKLPDILNNGEGFRVEDVYDECTIRINDIKGQKMMEYNIENEKCIEIIYTWDNINKEVQRFVENSAVINECELSIRDLLDTL